MIIKLFGFGIKDYFRDKLNTFDCLIVLFSIAEFMLSQLAGDYKTNLSIITAFKSLRIFRILKLVRSWATLRNLLTAIWLSFAGLVHFSILVGLFLIVMSLLGMEFFA